MCASAPHTQALNLLPCIYYRPAGLGRQFITLTVDTCVQHGGPEALRLAGLSVAAETCLQWAVLRREFRYKGPITLKFTYLP